MTAAGKITTKRMDVNDVVLLERAPWEGLAPAVRKGADTIPARVSRIDTVPGTARGGRRCGPTRYNVQLVAVQQPGAAPVTVNVSGSQTWWLASASAYWRSTLTAGR